MSSGRKSSGPSKDVANFLQHNHRELDELLNAGETFYYRDVDVSDSTFRKASLCGIIRRVDGQSSTEWTLKPEARERLEAYRNRGYSYPDGTPVCPHCGYEGFANLRDGDYECASEACEREFSEFAEVGENV